MPGQRAERNRTLTLAEDEIACYLDKCVHINAQSAYTSITDAVICGDILEVSDKLPDNFVDLLIADPPYNLDKIFGVSAFKQTSDKKYTAFTETWISKIKHTLKPHATVYVCCDWRSSIIIATVLQKYFYIQNRITWQREKGRGAKHNWKNSMEDIWFATVSPKNFTFNVGDVKMRRKVIAPYKVDGRPKDWVESADGNFRDTCPSNFWDDISVPYWSMPENTDHPAQKPEKLAAKLVLASSNAGDTVLDPFLGSGTSAVVAKKLKRRYLGIEREREYCALSQKRLEFASADSEIQGYSDGVFWERNTLALQQKRKPKKQPARFKPSRS
jgi:site-specific DNA-methyltransferase (adenine-specific)